jgi:hypothetical protein
MLIYLLFPRPGPFLGTGKVAFFVVGSAVALLAGVWTAGPATWLLGFIFYEVVLSQGKYLFNDFAGRRTDMSFERGPRNRFPRSAYASSVVLGYAAARGLAGIVGLLLVLGPAGAALGAATLSLQGAYEGVKLSRMPYRGLGLFLAVAANYGVRAIAGFVAAGGAVPTLVGLFTFIWAAAVGALFLSLYWQRQGVCYLERGRVPATLLERYKPGVLAVYRLRKREAALGSRPLPRQLLLVVLGVSLLTGVALSGRAPLRAAALAAGLAAAASAAYLLLVSQTAPEAAGANEEPHAA